VVCPWREKRVPVDLDIRVWGMDADGRAFSQNARTQNISASGAQLCEIEHDLKVGDIIGVQASKKKVRCKVVWARNTWSTQKIQVGVQLLSKQECPWIAFLPETNQDAPTVAPGCRRWARHKIAFPIALHDERTLRVTATDISGSGCYVEMLSPFPIGTGLGLELWIGTKRITTRALVRTCDPSVGMGIEFVGLKAEDQQRLQEHLQAVNPFNCSIEYKDPRSKKAH
jgi:PilZ domain-containing protein